MKRRDLVAELERIGCVLLRSGSKHDIYHNPKSGKLGLWRGVNRHFTELPGTVDTGRTGTGMRVGNQYR